MGCRHKFFLACTLLILAAFLSSSCGDMYREEKAAVQVDFSDVIARTNKDISRAQRPVLRYALKATTPYISTQKYYYGLMRIIGDRISYDIQFMKNGSCSELSEMLRNGSIDVAFVNSSVYVKCNSAFGLKLLAVPVPITRHVYYSYFIVGKESDVSSFEGLKGKKFAFTDPLSTTGYLIPTYYLLRRQKSADSFFGGHLFTYSHVNSIMAVSRGLADGAAVDSLVWDYLKSVNPAITSRVRIIARYPAPGGPTVVVRPTFDPGDASRLRRAFLTVHRDPKGGEILRRLRMARFEEGEDSDYGPVRQMLGWLSP